jgi:hypothetical protein
MLEQRGHKFVRYADDCNIYVKSSRAAERVMESCTKFLEGKLKLKVNRKKSTTGSPAMLKFLGFSLYRRKEGIGIRVHEKSLKRLKDRLKALTSRIRQMYWKRWKRVRTRFESLILFGIPREQAWQWANTRKNYWHTANSWILTRTVTNQYLKSVGFPDILERFEMLHERIERLLRIRTPIPTH